MLRNVKYVIATSTSIPDTVLSVISAKKEISIIGDIVAFFLLIHGRDEKNLTRSP